MGQKQPSLLLQDKERTGKGAYQINYKTELYPGIDLGIAASALQKSIRRNEQKLALQMAFLMVKRFPFYLLKRLCVIASEDVGSADPNAAILAASISSSWQSARARSAEYLGRVQLSHLVLYLCRAPKNREADSATILTGAMLDNNEQIEIPDWVWDKHTRVGKNMGRGMKHFLEEASLLRNESGKDEYKQKLVSYLKQKKLYK